MLKTGTAPNGMTTISLNLAQQILEHQLHLMLVACEMSVKLLATVFILTMNLICIVMVFYD